MIRFDDTAGENSRMAKLKEADVREIKRRRAAGETLAAIAADFGVSDSCVGKICRGKLWRSCAATLQEASSR